MCYAGCSEKYEKRKEQRVSDLELSVSEGFEKNNSLSSNQVTTKGIECVLANFTKKDKPALCQRHCVRFPIFVSFS